MRNSDDIVFQIWMRIILGLLFLISILFKLGLELDYISTQVVAREGLDWMTAPWIVRGILTVEIGIFLFLIFLKFGKSFRKFYFIIVGILFLQHIFLYNRAVMGSYGLLSYCNVAFEQDAGFSVSSSYSISVVAAILFVLIGFFTIQIKENYLQLKWYYMIGISLLFAIGIHSADLPKMESFKATDSAPIISTGVWNPFIKRLYEKTPEINEKEALLCSFSVTCSHCNEFASRIGAQLRGSENDSKSQKPIIFLFYTTDPESDAFQQEVDAFMSRNVESQKSLINIMILNRSEMINLTGSQFPVFTVLENRIVTKMMISDQFNYFERDAFFNSI